MKQFAAYYAGSYTYNNTSKWLPPAALVDYDRLRFTFDTGLTNDQFCVY